jgi:hypothetical protein
MLLVSGSAQRVHERAVYETDNLRRDDVHENKTQP